MTAFRTAVISTGVANTASVVAALKRAGCEPYIIDDADALAAADALVLPGVGAFAAAMDVLRDRGLAAPIRDWFEAGRPALAVCLGLQLLARSSDESPCSVGLGVIDAHIESLPATVRVPHMGWNIITPTDAQTPILSPGCAYFANSYCLAECPAGWSAAMTTHGRPFVAATERGPQLACQFHPELSGSFGRDLIQRWVTSARASMEVQPC